jgi:hypothetical protein
MRYGGNGRVSKSIWVHEPIITPELKVWRAVLEQAYQDAELNAGFAADGPGSSECTKARRYLRADSPHEAANLKLVCDFADVPADRVILWARRHYAVEQVLENAEECGNSAAAFAAGNLREPANPMQGSWTPDIGC